LSTIGSSLYTLDSLYLCHLTTGGHTGEMIRMLQHIDVGKYTIRSYVTGSDDPRSGGRAKAFEESLYSAEAAGRQSYQAYSIPRARRVGQSWASTVLSSLHSMYYCFKFAAMNPNVVRDMTINSQPRDEMIDDRLFAMAQEPVQSYAWHRLYYEYVSLDSGICSVVV
jgi:hypothetical protein